jgi:hypothetical protein
MPLAPERLASTLALPVIPQSCGCGSMRRMVTHGHVVPVLVLLIASLVAGCGGSGHFINFLCAFSGSSTLYF